MAFQTVPIVSTVQQIKDRLLSRAFNGLSAHTPEKMAALIEERIRKAHEAMPYVRAVELYALAFEHHADRSPALEALNKMREEKGLAPLRSMARFNPKPPPDLLLK
jgi:hypothetical protein